MQLSFYAGNFVNILNFACSFFKTDLNIHYISSNNIFLYRGNLIRWNRLYRLWKKVGSIEIEPCFFIDPHKINTILLWSTKRKLQSNYNVEDKNGNIIADEEGRIKYLMGYFSELLNSNPSHSSIDNTGSERNKLSIDLPDPNKKRNKIAYKSALNSKVVWCDDIIYEKLKAGRK